MFDLVGGLPIHPLLVHAAVVLFPIMAVVTPLVLARPVWRPKLKWVVLLDLVTAVALVATAQSGEALQSRLSQAAGHTVAQDHGELGHLVALLGLALFVVALVSLLAVRRGGVLIPVAVVLVAVVGLAGIVATVVVGHSGATASWEQRIAGTPPPKGD